jgi:hypothetical protein
LPQDVQQGAPDEHEGKHALQGNTTTGAIQVLVLSPKEAPRLQTIENRSHALEALVGGPSITFRTGIEGTIGLANTEGAQSDLPLNHATDGMGTSISGTFVVAGDGGVGVTLQSISPLQLEQALERFAPTLPLAQFEQIMRSHTLGPQWIANWEPPEV